MSQLQPLPWLSMLHVLRNNLKNVLLTKTLEPGSESGHRRHNWSWSEPDVCLCPYFTLLTLANIGRQVTWSLVSWWSEADRDRDGVILCHLVSSCAIHLTIWHWSDVPCSRDAHHSALMSRPNSNKKNVNAVCIFFDRNISFNGVHSCGKGLFETRDVSLEKWSIPAVFNVPGYGVIGEAIWGSNKT